MLANAVLVWMVREIVMSESAHDQVDIRPKMCISGRLLDQQATASPVLSLLASSQIGHPQTGTKSDVLLFTSHL